MWTQKRESPLYIVIDIYIKIIFIQNKVKYIRINKRITINK